MIKLIAFDLNGVLLKSGHLVSENLMSFVEKPYSFVKKQYLKYSVGKISREDFWGSVGMDLKEGERKLYERVKLNVNLNLLEMLSKRYTLVIVSNLPKEWIKILFFDRAPKLFFKHVIISGDVGVRKPDRKMYEKLLSESKVSPNEIVFIDDKKSNLMVARDFGMITIWMRGRGDDAPFEPDFTISSLEELPSILSNIEKDIK